MSQVSVERYYLEWKITWKLHIFSGTESPKCDIELKTHLPSYVHISGIDWVLAILFFSKDI